MDRPFLKGIPSGKFGKGRPLNFRSIIQMKLSRLIKPYLLFIKIKD